MLAILRTGALPGAAAALGIALWAQAGASAGEAAAGDGEAAAPRLSLPPGPVAAALDGRPIPPATGAEVRVGGADVRSDFDAESWRAAEPWARYREALASASGDGSDEEAALARLELARIARDMGRGADAWSHLARSLELSGDGAFPEAAGAVLDSLIPGRFENDGETLFAPSLPPTPSAPPGERAPRLAEITRGGLHVDGAEIAMRISLESEGLQLDLTHVAGDACAFDVWLPGPPAGWTWSSTYQDWERRDAGQRAFHVELTPGRETYTIWARAKEGTLDWPRSLPDALPHAVIDRGVRLRTAGAADPEHGRIVGFASILEASLGVEVAIADASAGPEFGGLEIDLSASGLARLADLCGLLERHLELL